MPSQHDQPDPRRRSSQYGANELRNGIVVNHHTPTRGPSQRSRRNSTNHGVREPPKVYIPTGADRKRKFISLRSVVFLLTCSKFRTETAQRRQSMRERRPSRLNEGRASEDDIGINRRGSNRLNEGGGERRTSTVEPLEVVDIDGVPFQVKNGRVEQWVGDHERFRAIARSDLAPDYPSNWPPPSTSVYREDLLQPQQDRGYRSERRVPEEMVYEERAPDERRRQERRHERTHRRSPSPDIVDDCLDFLHCK